MSPVALITRRASASARSPITSMRSPTMPTSALNPGDPLPSTTVPPVMITSNIIHLKLQFHCHEAEYITGHKNQGHPCEPMNFDLRGMGDALLMPEVTEVRHPHSSAPASISIRSISVCPSLRAVYNTVSTPLNFAALTSAPASKRIRTISGLPRDTARCKTE